MESKREALAGDPGVTGGDMGMTMGGATVRMLTPLVPRRFGLALLKCA